MCAIFEWKILLCVSALSSPFAFPSVAYKNIININDLRTKNTGLSRERSVLESNIL